MRNRLSNEFDPGVQLVSKPGGLYLEIRFDQAWISAQSRELVTSASLGKAQFPIFGYEQPDGSRFASTPTTWEKVEANPIPRRDLSSARTG